jgi:hypothetical protein
VRPFTFSESGWDVGRDKSVSSAKFERTLMFCEGGGGVPIKKFFFWGDAIGGRWKKNSGYADELALGGKKKAGYTDLDERAPSQTVKPQNPKKRT